MKNPIFEHRKADDSQVKKLAQNAEWLRWARQPDFDRYDDSLVKMLDDLRGSGWAVVIFEAETHTHYAQALFADGKKAIAIYDHCRDEGISGLRICLL